MAIPLGSPNTIPPAAVGLVAEFEGLRTRAYLCPAGVWTIGYGHTLNVKKGDTCTPEQAAAWLCRDLEEAGADVRRLVKVPLSENQYGALASFTFNLGAGALKSSTLLRRLNAGEYSAVPAELKKWNKATVNGKKVILDGLTKRRAREGELWSAK